MMMVEKVARALLASESGGELAWEQLDLITRGAFKRDARAALTALLEPSEGMVEAVSDAIDEYVAFRADCADVIAVAIQAALDEKEG